MTDKRLGPYQTGELCYKAPTVMKGYYKRPKETAEFFDEEGWCKSGDAGYYDQDGRIYFVQRFKEMIKCMDNQVVPAELEELLLRKHSADIVEWTIFQRLEQSKNELTKINAELHAEMSDCEVAAHYDSALEYDDQAAGFLGPLRHHNLELSNPPTTGTGVRVEPPPIQPTSEMPCGENGPQKQHATSHCGSAFDYSEKRRVLTASGSCFRSTTKGHRAQDCRRKACFIYVLYEQIAGGYT
ncbi:hypothetical protein HPB49_022569 [Dermacentor silvarum]|uniref:Uncharacterized protein n=1 Tax=Dermacentor silvarum TaxID=543639 RepID=A0ACB8D0E7_DERSI|nr:hypothetical protein HPB49_022569 [Dermacentor silvarum]